MENIATTVSPANEAIIREAVLSLRLSHSQAPGTPSAERAAWAQLDDDTEVTVELVSPAESGFSAVELAEMFSTDQKKRSPEFWHPLFKDDEEWAVESVPIHAQDLIFHPSRFFPSGIAQFDVGAQYCLLARKRKRIVGVVLFGVDLSTFEDSWLPEAPDMDSIRTLDFTVSLDAVYVCNRYRNRGYGKALMQAVANVFDAEVLALSRQLAPVANTTGVTFHMHTQVRSEWVSRAGMLIHHELLDAIDIAVDFHNEGLDEEPERQALELHHADDDAGY